MGFNRLTRVEGGSVQETGVLDIWQIYDAQNNHIGSCSGADDNPKVLALLLGFEVYPLIPRGAPASDFDNDSFTIPDPDGGPAGRSFGPKEETT